MDDMENVPDANSSLKEINNTDYNDFSFTHMQYLHAFFMVLTLAEIIADVLIMYVILKYKFWKVPTYVLILNWTILDLFRLLTSSVITAAVLRITPNAIYPYMFVNISINMACLFGIVVTLLVLMLSHIRFFKVHHVKFIVIAWVVVAILVVTYMAATFSVNMSEEELDPLEIFSSAIIFFYFIGIIFVGAYLPLLIVVLIICVVYWIRRSYKKNTLAKIKLVLGTTYMSYWLLAILSAIVLALCQHYFDLVIRADLLLLYILMETNALANLCILQATDKRFKVYLFNLFRCSTNKYEPDITFETYEAVENSN